MPSRVVLSCESEQLSRGDKNNGVCVAAILHVVERHLLQSDQEISINAVWHTTNFLIRVTFEFSAEIADGDVGGPGGECYWDSVLKAGQRQRGEVDFRLWDEVKCFVCRGHAKAYRE